MTSTVHLGLPMAVPDPELPSAVRIYEVGPRDGLQAERVPVPVEVKAEFVRRLVGAGLSTVELTSFVSPKRIPQLADARELAALTDFDAGIRHPVLVPNARGLEDALAAGAREVAVFASVTESFSKANLGAPRSDVAAAQALVTKDALAAGVDVRGYLSMVFGDPWEGPVPVDAVVEASVAMMETGVHSLSLGDTIGVATPGHVRAVVRALVDAGIAVDRIALHAHDTYGQALANVYAALTAGVTEFDASTGGVGGCPFALSATGNLATEDLVWMLRGLGIDTGVDLTALVETSTWLAGHLGRPSPSRVVTALAPSITDRSELT
ncbi:hydroxymethylglutaryl-CoA lyase [Nocardioides sp. Root151]|uniref:hydroxymethylglutaryl-CoA lyase n=1 Tax=Nocardioides sp. Root151 TaxID=1736475 RepID=UPI0007036C11|nr:hydroxymethylglutaryl-CoA lyase [Nocardioides sp. Root151]KQZ67122.1 hydroxymethylglutaryl-CoA lyase [Nocardioides sp. Root151]